MSAVDHEVNMTEPELAYTVQIRTLNSCGQPANTKKGRSANGFLNMIKAEKDNIAVIESIRKSDMFVEVHKVQQQPEEYENYSTEQTNLVELRIEPKDETHFLVNVANSFHGAFVNLSL